MAAFVALVGFGDEGAGRDQAGVCTTYRARRVTQVFKPNLTSCVFAMKGEQTGLEGEQAQRRQGSCALGAQLGVHPLAAVRHQAGGHVHAQQGGVGLTQTMHVLLQLAFWGAGMAQTQQCIDP